MNWEALAAIGELVAAAGVIATLVYLSVQVRQNTRAIRSATLNSVTVAQQAELRWSSDISQAVRRAMHTPADLTEDETHQMTEWMTASFLARENEFSQFRQGLLDESKWEQSEYIIRSIFGMPWCRQWWSIYGREVYTADFVACVDCMMTGESFDTPGALKELEGWSPSDD
jgi:hypothetical protein